MEAVVSVGGHAYRQDIRQAAYRFINAHLKGDARPVSDSEIDIVSEGSNPGPYPIPPEKLRVFPTDADLPADQLNTKIDEHFVPLGKVAAPEAGRLDAWKKQLLNEFRRVSFGYFPDAIPGAKKLGDIDAGTERLRSEEEIEFRLRFGNVAGGAKSVLLVVLNEDEAGTAPEWVQKVAGSDQTIVFCEPRGIGATKWTRKNPPNYVERSHVLLGRTVDAGRVWDVMAAAQYLPADSRLKNQSAKLPIQVAGSRGAGLIAAYAAVLNDQIAEVTLVSPPTSHMSNSAPQLLNVLRVCDIADVLGLIAPRPLTIVGSNPSEFTRTAGAYSAAAATERLSFK